MASAMDRVIQAVPLVEKYRPQSMDGFVFVNENLKDFVESSLVDEKFLRRMPHLIFYGPPGVGKTTMAQLMAREAYGVPSNVVLPMCKSTHDACISPVIHLNASVQRSVADIRQYAADLRTHALRLTLCSDDEDARTSAILSRYDGLLFVIIDEAHALTPDAQQALRRVVEDTTSYVRYIFICNKIDKLHPAIYSRCRAFRFSAMPTDQLVSRLNQICIAESVVLKNNTDLETIARATNGDLRRAMQLLHQYMSLPLEARNVYSVIGSVDAQSVASLVDDIFNKTVSLTALFDTVSNILHQHISGSGISSSISLLDEMIQCLMANTSMSFIQLSHVLVETTKARNILAKLVMIVESPPELGESTLIAMLASIREKVVV